jgi:hypothetical protein
MTHLTLLHLPCFSHSRLMRLEATITFIEHILECSSSAWRCVESIQSIQVRSGFERNRRHYLVTLILESPSELTTITLAFWIFIFTSDSRPIVNLETMWFSDVPNAENPIPVSSKSKTCLLRPSCLFSLNSLIQYHQYTHIWIIHNITIDNHIIINR